MIKELNKTGDNKPQRNEKGQLLPGNTANPKGRPLDSISLTDAIKRRLKDLSPDQKRTALDWLADNIIQDALENNNAMRKLIWNYVDGMPRASLDITSVGEKISGINYIIPNGDNNPTNPQTASGK